MSKLFVQDKRSILHLDLDTFFVSVERLQDSRLEGKPIVIGGNSARGVVSSCSYEARRFGIHSAMPMKMALRLCNEAVVINGDMELYSRYSRLVTEIIDSRAPVYEKASIDEHYLDLTGMDRFFGNLRWAHELRQTIIQESGLPISFGLSLNKTVSKIATGEAKPNGEIEVEAVNVQPFLNPLSIRKIPGVGQKSYQLLRSMGVATISTLAQIPPEMMQRVLGKNGLDIWNKANGIDPTPVKPYIDQKSISSERTFERDTTDLAELNRILTYMVEKLAYQLRKSQRVAGLIAVKIRYSDFDTHSMQKRIPYTAQDHQLLAVARELFAKVNQRRILIRLIGLRLGELVYGAQQLSLFDDSSEMAQLYWAMDKIKKRYGSKCIGRALSYRYDTENEKIVQSTHYKELDED